VFDIDLFDVPYRSGPQGVADVVAGSVPLFADVPTFGEALGLTDYQPAAWFGFAAPRGTPDPIVRRLAQQVLACVNEAGVKAKLDGMGAQPPSGPPQRGRSRPHSRRRVRSRYCSR